MKLTTEQILALVGQAFALYTQIRNAATSAGISDAELDVITADYVNRIARREGEIAAPPAEG